jgi:hypothetical protein
MQMKAWQVDVIWFLGDMQEAENALHLVDEVRPDLAAITVDV